MPKSLQVAGTEPRDTWLLANSVNYKTTTKAPTQHLEPPLWAVGISFLSRGTLEVV